MADSTDPLPREEGKPAKVPSQPLASSDTVNADANSPSSGDSSQHPSQQPARSSRIRFGAPASPRKAEQGIESALDTLSPSIGTSDAHSPLSVAAETSASRSSEPAPSVYGGLAQANHTTSHTVTLDNGNNNPPRTPPSTIATFLPSSNPSASSTRIAFAGESSPGPRTPPIGASSPTPASPPPPPVAYSAAYTISPIDSATSHRVIRTVVHTDYAAEQAECEALAKRQRTYFVASDLSDEAVYALEWTIANFLRNGDTLLAIYAVEVGEDEMKGKKDKEKGDSKPSGSPPSSGRSSGNATPGSTAGTPDTITTSGHGATDTMTGLPIGSGGVAMIDAQDTIRKLNSREEPAVLRKRARSRSASASASGSRTHTPNGERIKPMDKAESMRFHAIRLLTQICTRALARRDVKVQVAIEVIHCRSPKHMITEAIDTLEPTLVILGSRGRSALKGVLLGSFSNYLVTKSSVPVLVARKPIPTLSSKSPTAKEPQRPSTYPHLPQILRQIAHRDGPGEIANKLVTARVD